MREKGYVEGTRGITYVHKNDERRHRSRCTHHKKDGACAYMTKCGGSAHCPFYDEIPSAEKHIIKSVTMSNEGKREHMGDERKSNDISRFTGVQTIMLSDIIVPDKFLRYSPDANKVQELLDYYQIHKRLDKPIFVSIRNGKYYLEDKYLRYYVAKILGKTWIWAKIGNFKESKDNDRLLKIGRKVVHKKFGQGVIVKSDVKRIHITFESGKTIKFDSEVCIKNNLFTFI